MATCPKCNCHFRLPEDEQTGHNCPRCGYSEEQAEEEREEEREVDVDAEVVGAEAVR